LAYENTLSEETFRARAGRGTIRLDGTEDAESKRQSKILEDKIMSLFASVLINRKRPAAQTVTEYALIVVAVAVLALAAYTSLGGTLSAIVASISGSL
jgi:hypothetical protein